MPEYRIGEAAELLHVSVDTVRRWADTGRLPSQRTAGGQRLIDGAALAAFAAAQLPDDREPAPIVGRSTRNRFPGIVTRVTKDTVMAQIEMVCGPYRVVSLMSAEAATELGLEPGVRAIASVKSTNVVVEVP